MMDIHIVFFSCNTLQLTEYKQENHVKLYKGFFVACVFVLI